MKLLYILLSFFVSIVIYFYINSDKSVKVKNSIARFDYQEQKYQAYKYLNKIRENIGLATLQINSNLTKAAQGHANYLVANNESSHFEKRGLKNFIGERLVDRTLVSEYKSTTVSENLSTNIKDAKASIKELFSAIYHRFDFLSPKIDSVGIGVAQDKNKTSNNAFVYVMGNSNLEKLCEGKGFNVNDRYYFNLCKNKNLRVPKEVYDNSINSLKMFSTKIICYPYNKQKDVSPVFYEESPDPLPNMSVSGFPVSVEFNDYYFKNIKVKSFKLFDCNNRLVKSIFMDKNSDPNGLFKANQYALFPLKRLEFNSKYRVELKYIANGKEILKKWSFRTIKPKGRIHKIPDNETTLYLTKNSDYILYFPPKNGKDLIKDIIFPSDLNIDFLDHNTIKIGAIKRSDKFTIKSQNREVHIVVQ